MPPEGKDNGEWKFYLAESSPAAMAAPAAMARPEDPPCPSIPGAICLQTVADAQPTVKPVQPSGMEATSGAGKLAEPASKVPPTPYRSTAAPAHAGKILDVAAPAQRVYQLEAPTKLLDVAKPVKPLAAPAPAATPLSYPLGAEDISKIVDAILSPLAPLLPGLTKEDLYVLLHTEVLNLSKGKTFTNKDDLDVLVKDIVKKIVNAFLKASSNNSSTVLPAFITSP